MSNVLTVRLPPGVRERFASWCSDQGTTPSATIRAGVVELLDGIPEPADTPQARLEHAPDPSPKHAVRVWLTETELTAVDRHREKTGGTRPAWIVRAIRGALTRAPEFGSQELEVLGRSNTELLAIGRNLNQIARRLNEHQRSQPLEADMVEALGKTLAQHVDAVHAAMAASRERWGVAS